MEEHHDSCCHGDHGERSSASTSAPHAVVWVCPMHPEVKQNAPGACPKCGMALEPETPGAVGEQVEYTCPMHP